MNGAGGVGQGYAGYPHLSAQNYDTPRQPVRVFDNSDYSATDDDIQRAIAASVGATYPPAYPIDTPALSELEIYYRQEIAARAAAQPQSTEHKKSILSNEKIRELVNAAHRAEETQSFRREPPPSLSRYQIFALDVQHLYHFCENPLTSFKVSLLACMFLGGQDILSASILASVSSILLIPVTKGIEGVLDRILPVGHTWSDFKTWLDREDASVSFLKTHFKTAFIAGNILFRAGYDLTTSYCIYQFINSDDPLIQIAGIILGLFFLKGYVDDMKGTKDAWYQVKIEHMTRSITEGVPDQFSDDAVLNESKCVATQAAIYYPAKLEPCGHEMELKAAITWLGNHEKCASCRVAVTGITFNEVHFKEVNDRIAQLSAEHPTPAVYLAPVDS